MELWLITFFIYKNLKVGKSLIEENTKKIIKEIYEKAEKHKCEILIPEDCVVSSSFNGKWRKKKFKYYSR